MSQYLLFVIVVFLRIWFKSFLKVNHLKSTEGVLEVNTSYGEEYLGINLKINFRSPKKKKNFF